MALLRIEKVNSLPIPLNPNTLYFVKTGELVEQFISDEEGISAYKVTDSSVSVTPMDSFLLLGAA